MKTMQIETIIPSISIRTCRQRENYNISPKMDEVEQENDEKKDEK